MPNTNYQLTAPFVAALAELGLRHVCISPGSRNTPLTIPFADTEGIRDWSHHDERSGAFFALGIAKADPGRPVALVSTSGTAAANFLPAIVEARHARVPLLVLTADRPAELRDVGAPQAIDQVGMYGRAVKWSHEVAEPGGDGPAGGYAVTLAARAWAASLDAPAGPVHLNFPFRDPLVPDRQAGPAIVPDRPPAYLAGRLLADDLDRAVALLSGRRTVVVAGALPGPEVAREVAHLAATARFPVVADPLSQLRAGAHDLDPVITTGDVLTRAGMLDGPLAPEAVLRFGAAPTSKSLTAWLAHHPEIVQVLVDEAGWRDHGHRLAMMVRGEPGLTAATITKAVSPAPEGWLELWRSAETITRRALAALPFPSEPGTVAALADSLPDRSSLVIGSSMPIRDVDAFFPAIPRRVGFFGNRGANGIDGLVSTTLGVAVASAGSTFALAGDLSVVHDIGALATAARLDIPATLVVVDNDGGGIFHFLPQVDHPRHFERHLATPHGLDLVRVAAAFGIEAEAVATGDRLRELLATPARHPRLLLIGSQRTANVTLHRRLFQEAAAALAGWDGR